MDERSRPMSAVTLAIYAVVIALLAHAKLWDAVIVALAVVSMHARLSLVLGPARRPTRASDEWTW